MTTVAASGERREPVGTFPIAFLRELVELVSDEVDVGQALRDAGIPPVLVDEHRSRVTIEQAARFIRNLWRATDDEVIGLGQERVPRGTFRMLALAVVHTNDLGSALERLSEFSRVVAALPTAVVENRGDGQVRVAMGVHDAGLEDASSAVLLAVVQRFSSWLVSRRIDVTLVELPGEQPADRTHLDLVFGAPLRFGAEVPALWFDQRLLAAPVTQDEASLEAYLHECPQVWLSRKDFGTTIEERVRRILGRTPVTEWPRSEELARTLAMSPQTLRRRLAERGSSVAQMKDLTRRDLAVTSLSTGHESVADLAVRLGFSEPSAFHRAFRRWTGQAPGAYRTSAAGGREPSTA